MVKESSYTSALNKSITSYETATKQEEIRERVAKWLGSLEKATELMKYLRSKGVVIKVECSDCNGSGDYFFGCEACKGLGYTIEPLIKEPE